jgi:hypothetical protein
MRIGNLDIPGGLLVMPAFVLVVALLFLWAWYDYSSKKGGMQTLAESRGWNFLGENLPELPLWLEEVEAGRSWRPYNIILVQGPPDKIYLFNFQIRVSGGRGGSSDFGTACLAERPDGQTRELVMIEWRSPLPFLDKLKETSRQGGVEVGAPEFRQKFMVWCRRPDIAAATVTSGLQEVLLRQRSSLIWDRVLIAGRHVLVTATYRMKPEAWDELLGMTKRLRTALP